MNIKQTIITAAVALTMVAMIAPMTVGADTASTIQAEIVALQAQLNSLNGSSTTTTSTGTLPADCVGVTFSRNLRVGMSGQDVQCLQVILNMSASTQVSVSGAGSPGMESMYFGAKTLSAVMKWQAAAGFTPASQVGPLSRAKLNAWLMGTTNTTTTTTTTTGGYPAGCTSASGFSPSTGLSCSSGTTVSSTGPVSVMLSSDTPAAGAIVGGQATADLAHFTFTGSGTVTSVTLTRTGISDQNTLTNVYLYQGNTRLTDGYSFNLNGQIVMNGLSIVVNGSQEISVRADVATTAANTASTIAVTLTSYTANATTSSSNVMGNTMAIATGNLATVSIGTNTVAGANVNAGTTQYTFWSAPLQINTRAVWLKTASFREIGSAPSNALGNINLYVDGVNTGVMGTIATINGSTYIMFDLTSAPVTLTTGSHTLAVEADVQAGADRSVQLSVQQAADLTLFDSQVGVNVAASGTPSSAGTINILTGSTTVVIDPAFAAKTNISGGAANSVIGRFIIHSYGEDVKINSIIVDPALTGLAATTVSSGGANSATSQTLTVGSTSGFVAGNYVSTGSSAGAAVGTVTTITDGTHMTVNFTTAPGSTTPTLYVTNEGLNNVTLYFNGSQVGSQQNWNGSTALPAFQLGSQVIAPAGQDSILEVHADMQGSNNVAYGAGTVTAELDSGSTANAQGQTSQNSTFVPGSTVEGTITTSGLSIQTGLLAVSKNTAYLNQSISPNMSGVQIGSYIIQNQSTSESIRLTSFNVVTYTDGSNPPTTTTDITNLSALRTSDTTGSGSTPVQPTGNDNFSVNDTLAPGASMVLNVFANTSTMSSIYVKTLLKVSSIGVTDNISATSSQIAGQVLTLGTGTMATPTMVVSSTTPAQYIPSGASGASNASQATFNFVATNGSATITEMKFTVSDSSATGYNSVTNVCVTPTSGSPICAQPVAGTADITGLQLAVPNGGGGLIQNVQVSYSGVGTSGLTPSTGSAISLAYAKYTTGGSTKTIGTSTVCTATLGTTCSATISAVTAPYMTLEGSVPVVTITQTTPAGGLQSAENQIGQVTVAASTQGAIKVNQIVFNASSSGWSSTAPVFSAPRLANGNTTITGAYCTGSGTGTATITCIFNSTGAIGGSTGYQYDYLIGAGQSQTFNLYATTALTSSTTTGAVSTAVPAASFKWDDASENGAGGTNVDLGLTGSTPGAIYNFPTNSYSIHQ